MSDRIQLPTDDEEWFGTAFRVVLDDITVARLMKVSDECHADPRSVIAAMVSDILEDDELAHGSDGSDDFMLLQ